MATVTTYPSVPTPGVLTKAVNQFRTATFPAVVDVATLKRLEIAPTNESYIVTAFKFLGFINDDGTRNDDEMAFFFEDESGFQSGLEAAMRRAYKALFDDRGDAVWTLPGETLTAWFRVADKTSALVAKRQARTFTTLAALAGHETRGTNGTSRATATARPAKAAPAAKAAASKTGNPGSTKAAPSPPEGGPALHVDVQIHIASDASAEQIDQIFASMAKHLYPAR